MAEGRNMDGQRKVRTFIVSTSCGSRKSPSIFGMYTVPVLFVKIKLCSTRNPESQTIVRKESWRRNLILVVQ